MVETKESKRKRIEANLKAKEKLYTVTLPIVGSVFLLIVIIIYMLANRVPPPAVKPLQ